LRKKFFVPPLTAVKEPPQGIVRDSLKPRQLIGQPSSPGLVTARARVIRSVDDFGEVVKGEILVFDAVQPQVTFIISLAGGIVERRGGMLCLTYQPGGEDSLE
jgi:phosphoenolpyruvate synthase/pyruvate phosphate dikinase